MNLRRNGAVLFAGLAVASAGFTLSQLKLIGRVLSVVDLEIDGAEGPFEPDGSVGSSDFRIASNVSLSEKTGKSTERKPSFKTPRGFPEELITEFISGAKDEAAIRQKRKREKQKEKKRKQKHVGKQSRPKKVKLKVPTPVFVPSLPKSGTSTTHQYFQCGGRKSAHLAARNEDSIFKIGRCTQRNLAAGSAPFAGCGDYDIWTDTGYVAARYQRDRRELKNDNIQCFYPLIDALDQVYESYPNATFLFVVRETEGWLKSIQSYHDGFIMDVWKRCQTRGFPGLDGTLEDFRDFYEWHKDMIRTFAVDHPSWTYIEVDLESPETAQTLQDRIGIDASCWGHYNKGSATEATKSGNHQLYEEEESEE